MIYINYYAFKISEEQQDPEGIENNKQSRDEEGDDISVDFCTRCFISHFCSFIPSFIYSYIHLFIYFFLGGGERLEMQVLGLPPPDQGAAFIRS